MMLMPAISIADVVGWVLKQRRGKAFINQTRQQIGWSIERAINHDAFGYVTDMQGEMLGLCLATPDGNEKTLRVHQILCIDKRALPALVGRFRKQFKGYRILANRRGREVSYDTKRLIEHIL